VTVRQAFSDTALQSRFEREGFVIVPLLALEEIARLEAEALRLLPESPQANEPHGSAYLTYFDLELRERASALIQSFVNERLVSILPGYRPLYATFFHKQAGANEMALHQHAPYVSDFRDTVINCWCPLIDCDEMSGTLQIVPRSHQLLRHVQTPQTPHYWNGFVDAVRERHLETIPVPAGHAILFEDSMPHGSTANRRDVARIATLTTLIPNDATPAFFVGSENDAAAYAADNGFCYSDFFHDRLPPQQEWRLLATVENSVARIGEREFERCLAERRSVAGHGFGLLRFFRRSAHC